MNYEEFKNYIKEHLLEIYEDVRLSKILEGDKIVSKLSKVNDQTEVIIQELIKNNGIKLDAVSIFFDDKITSPNIYLKPFYDNYIMGKPIDIIMQEIVECYMRELTDLSHEVTTMSDYDKVKDRIVIRLINYDKNKELLEQCVHERYLDLAITYRYLVGETEFDMASMIITNNIFSKWNIEQSDLYENAMSNTKILFPWMIQSLTDIIIKYYEKRINEILSDDEKEMFIEDYNPGEMYVLTNRSKAFGAGCLLYDDIIRHFSETKNANIFILPSSVHETMLVPEYDDVNPLHLKDVLVGANKQAVGLIDLLSDNIYYYDRASNEIKIYEFAEEKSA